MTDEPKEAELIRWDSWAQCGACGARMKDAEDIGRMISRTAADYGEIREELKRLAEDMGAEDEVRTGRPIQEIIDALRGYV